MPWLVKDKDCPEKNLLYVHVPRCGGTSLTKHFNVPQKCRKGRDPWHWFGMVYFFYRYHLLETANYPVISFENGIFIIEYIIAIILISIGVQSDAQYSLFGTGAFMFISSTFLFTAPVIGRNQVSNYLSFLSCRVYRDNCVITRDLSILSLSLKAMRRFYGVFVGRLLCNFVGNNEWLTGTSHLGFLVHFTAPKMLKYKLVTEEELDQADSFAIVRNPYSRMVSVYMYNRMGPLEGFKSFAKDWVKNKMKIYKKTGSTEEWDIYCHAVPAHEFTHLNGMQIVKCIVKQEELKTLWFPGLTKKSIRHNKRLGEIPQKVAEALQGMPHTNQRSRSKPWWDYYDQETLDLVAEAYAKDFFYFGYSTELPNRPDLKPPKLDTASLRSIQPFSSNLDFSIYKDTSLEELAKRRTSRASQLNMIPESKSEDEAIKEDQTLDSDSQILDRIEKGESLDSIRNTMSSTSKMESPAEEQVSETPSLALTALSDGIASAALPPTASATSQQNLQTSEGNLVGSSSLASGVETSAGSTSVPISVELEKSISDENDETETIGSDDEIHEVTVALS